MAIDELRWLLEVCRDMIEAHFLLGKLAVEAEHDVPLARGHFGYAYQLGVKAPRPRRQPDAPLAAAPGQPPVLRRRPRPGLVPRRAAACPTRPAK